MAARPHPAISPAAARAVAVDLVRTLRAAGHTAYLAGGCVRDELLGLHPTDYDVATDAPPRRITEIFPRTAEVGASFGVVLVKSRGVSVEVATFRSDGPYSDRRRPDTVHFSDPKSDALRRDFTINALFLDPLDEADPTEAPACSGRVIDFVNGRSDLRRKILRAVGDPDQRLAEDHLRALRAVRFAARLGLTIEPATADALTRHARGLEGVSRERIGDELRRVLIDPRRADALTLLQSLGLDAPVLQEPNQRSAPLIVASAEMSDTSSTAVVVTSLAAWALDRGLVLSPADAAFGPARDAPSKGRRAPTALDSLTDRWRRALCLSNEESDLLGRTLGALATIEHAWSSLGVAPRKRLASMPAFPGAMRLLTARRPELAASVRADVAELANSAGGLAPGPLVSGDDLVAAGFKPGPAFKGILDRVYDAQLEGRVGDARAALELAALIARENRA